MTKAEFLEWKKNPRAVSEERHKEECGGYGFVYLDDDDGASAVCPVCRYHKNRKKLLDEMASAGISQRYLETEWEQLTITKPLAIIKKACERIEAVVKSGTSAILTGPPGTGKSTAAAMMAKTAIEANMTAHMANIGRISALVRASYDNGGGGWTEAKAIEWLATPDLLVLDDLGAGETREGSHEVKLLYLALEQRQANGLITVVTTNLSEDALRQRIGERVMNRLMPYKVITFVGKNWRRAKADEWPI